VRDPAKLGIDVNLDITKRDTYILIKGKGEEIEINFVLVACYSYGME